MLIFSSCGEQLGFCLHGEDFCPPPILGNNHSQFQLFFFFKPHNLSFLNSYQTLKATRKHSYIRALNYKNTKVLRAEFPIQTSTRALTCHLTAEL